MSLINDALKRAKAAQQDAPAPESPGPQMHPADTETFVRHSVGFLVPIVLAATALLILFFVWQYGPRTRTARQAEVRARDLPQQTIPVQPSRAPQEVTKPKMVLDPSQTEAPIKAKQGSTPVAARTDQSHSSVMPTAPEPAVQLTAMAPTSTPPAGVETTVTNATTNTPAPVVQQPPPTPRLQGIVFDRKRPSAVINGKTVFIGDRVAGFRVVAIGRDNATLVSSTRTNFLVLED